MKELNDILVNSNKTKVLFPNQSNAEIRKKLRKIFEQLKTNQNLAQQSQDNKQKDPDE